MTESRQLQRLTHITAAYDCIRNPCKFGSDKCKPGGRSGGNHGIHSCELRMTVRGPSAEIMLVIVTGWDLPTVPKHARPGQTYPNGAYVEFHTAAPMYEDQEAAIRMEVADDAVCKSWDRCYNDRSYLLSDTPTTLLVEKGSEAVWEWLEAQHDKVVCKMLSEED